MIPVCKFLKKYPLRSNPSLFYSFRLTSRICFIKICRFFDDSLHLNISLQCHLHLMCQHLYQSYTIAKVFVGNILVLRPMIDIFDQNMAICQIIRSRTALNTYHPLNWNGCPADNSKFDLAISCYRRHLCDCRRRS